MPDGVAVYRAWLAPRPLWTPDGKPATQRLLAELRAQFENEHPGVTDVQYQTIGYTEDES
jgi:hypothetical protein